jgi:ferredoxin
MPLPVSPAPSAVDLLRWPIIGAVLRWRHVRTVTQIALLLVAAAIVVHGFVGPQVAATNLSTLLTWIYYRGLLIGVLLVAANLFCAACPMILVRDLARRVHFPSHHWPRWLGRKSVAIALFVGVLFVYELFDLWARPDATAALVVAYFAAAVLVDTTFRGAAFCKHVCPVGQFNFVASTLSPLEVRIRTRTVCQTCTTVDCIKGRRDPAEPSIVLQRGCELALFQPTKIGNLDCTFCLDCVHACPHDNVAIGVRVPGDELADDRRRSSIGRLSRRPDLALLVLVFTFGAMLNAFAMTGPVYALEQWLARTLDTSREAPVLGLVFVIALGVIPVALCAGAAGLTARLAPGSGLRVVDEAVRQAYALAPLGAGIWLAHYGFHFLTGLGTIVPVTQSAVVDATGRALLGAPEWGWLGIRAGAVFPLQMGATLLGAFGSIALVHRIASRDHHDRGTIAALPWVALVVGLTALVLWIFAQPMEMRGAGLG